MSTTEPQPSPPFLSDLCLLAVLGEMNLKNRLAASKVCPRWFHRVREVNQAVRSIAIAVQARRGEEEDDDGGWRSELLDGHRGTIESEPSVRLLKKADGSPLYPLEPPPLTAADCLMFDELSDITTATTTTITAQQIIAAFPRVTQLVFLGGSDGEEYQHLVAMLVSPVWRSQLTRLRLIDRSSSGCQQQRRLFAAINGLTSLRQLTLDLVSGDLSLLDLSALARLETVRIDCLQGLRYFLACLRKYVAASGGNALRGGLPRVELVNVGRDYLKELRELSLPLRRLIARLVEDEPVIIRPRRSIASVLTTYPALSSLELGIPPWQVHQVFADLASLGGSGGGGLFHLRLEVNFCYCSEEEDRRPFLPPPVAALSSVKALDLSALARLETLRIDCLQGLRSFLACLRKYGAASTGSNALRGGALPRVELVNAGRGYLKELGTLSLPLRRLIARLVEEDPMSGPRQRITSLFTTCPALSSLELYIPHSRVRQVFADLASLGGGGGLFHLRLDVSFFDCKRGKEKGRRPFLRPPVAALSSVKALDLAVANHADLEWFNLPVTMPALEAIYLNDVYCDCWYFSECKTEPSGQSSATDQCLRAAYETLQRTGLPPSQIAFNRNGKVCTMEELLNKDEPFSSSS